MKKTSVHGVLCGLDVVMTATSLLVQAGFLPCPRGRATPNYVANPSLWFP